jgi:hypothetical protein
MDGFPFLTLAGAALVAAEAAWERRTRRELEACQAAVLPPRLPELLERWKRLGLPLSPGTRQFYAEHFEAEIRVSRRAVWSLLPVLACLDAALPPAARGPAAGLLVLLPLSKRAAKGPFNEVEAALPVVGEMALLREEEVLWGLAAAAAREGRYAEQREALLAAPVPSRARRRAARLLGPQPDEPLFRRRAAECRRRRLALQKRGLAWLALAAGGLAALVWLGRTRP